MSARRRSDLPNPIGGGAKTRSPGRLALLAAHALPLGACSLLRGGATAEGRTRSADGTEISFSAGGIGDTALVFIHGGLADRSFWAPQMASLAGEFRVVALDLGGHGVSGRGRRAWTIRAFAEDVLAVVDALRLDHVVLIGNSLGVPVALEAAARLQGRVLGVVGVDTLRDATAILNAKGFQERAAAFRADFPGACRQMVRALFHPGAHPDLQAWVEGRMLGTSPEVAAGVMEGLAGYDVGPAFRGAGVPIRAINGDLWPTYVDRVRTVAPDFEAVVLRDAGHYPMLERPTEFNRVLVQIVRDFESRSEEPGSRR